MKASDLTTIPDDYSRFIQASKFLKGLEESRAIAMKVRDVSLLRLRRGEDRIPQSRLARDIGVNQQRISAMESEAMTRLNPRGTEPNFDEWMDDAEPIEI